jgi:hypothetical protein
VELSGLWGWRRLAKQGAKRENDTRVSLLDAGAESARLRPNALTGGTSRPSGEAVPRVNAVAVFRGALVVAAIAMGSGHALLLRPAPARRAGPWITRFRPQRPKPTAPSGRASTPRSNREKTSKAQRPLSMIAVPRSGQQTRPANIKSLLPRYRAYAELSEDVFRISEPKALTTGGYLSYQSGYLADFLQLNAMPYTTQPLYANQEAGPRGASPRMATRSPCSAKPMAG